MQFSNAEIGLIFAPLKLIPPGMRYLRPVFFTFFSMAAFLLASVSLQARGSEVGAKPGQNQVLVEHGREGQPGREDMKVKTEDAPLSVKAGKAAPAKVQKSPSVRLKTKPSKVGVILCRPRRYMDQKTVGLVTLLGGIFLALLGGGINLAFSGTMATGTAAMILGLATISLVLGILFTVAGVLMLIAAS